MSSKYGTAAYLQELTHAATRKLDSDTRTMVEHMKTDEMPFHKEIDKKTEMQLMGILFDPESSDADKQKVMDMINYNFQMESKKARLEKNARYGGF